MCMSSVAYGRNARLGAVFRRLRLRFFGDSLVYLIFGVMVLADSWISGLYENARRFVLVEVMFFA